MNNRKHNEYAIFIKDNKFILQKVMAKDKEYFYTCETQEEAEKLLKEWNKFDICDYDESELINFYLNIDKQPLNDFISQLIGIGIKFNFSNLRNGKYISFTSDINLINYFPILEIAWKELYVESFNSSLSCNSETGELYWWGDINFNYKHQKGGSNGAEIARFNYSITNGWEIISAKEDRLRYENR